MTSEINQEQLERLTKKLKICIKSDTALGDFLHLHLCEECGHCVGDECWEHYMEALELTFELIWGRGRREN